MSRDMKPRKRQPAKKKSGGGTLVGMFIGLVLGVVIAAGVVWYLNKSPLPFVDKAQPPARPTTAIGKNGQASQPPGPAGQAGRSVPEKRFQFYDIPARQGRCGAGQGTEARGQAGRNQEGREKGRQEGRRSKGVEDAALPQAGSFSTAQDADNQRPSWRFMGIEAVVQQVMIQDKTFYRVRVGPRTRRSMN